MRRIQAAIQSRDPQILQSMLPPIKPASSKTTEAVVDLFNELFKQLRAAFPAATALIKTQEELDVLRQQWILAFKENGIDSTQQIAAGMTVARRQESPFLPSPGQFIAWCKQGAYQAIGLPDEWELYQMVVTYCRTRSEYQSAEDYPWQNHFDYWLVTDLVLGMRRGNWTDSELRKEAGLALIAMAKRIDAGQTIPVPVKRLTRQTAFTPLTHQQNLEKINQLRAKYGLKRR